MTRWTYNKGTDEGLADLRRSVEGHNVEILDKRARSGAWGLDAVLVWMLVFGVWPLAHPAHDGETLMSLLDLVLHWGSLVWLTVRWKVVRR